MYDYRSIELLYICFALCCVYMYIPLLQITLEQRPVQIASEYFTKDEVVQFRKPKRKKKVRRLKADDLLGLSAEKNELETR